MGKKPRAPLIVVKSDDYEQEYGGEKYHPHVGEEVVFRRHISAKNLMNLLSIQGMGEGDSEWEVAEFLHDVMCPSLAQVIQSWTWKNPYTEEAYGPPTADTLRELHADELNYLLGKWFEATAPSEQAGNARPALSEQ